MIFYNEERYIKNRTNLQIGFVISNFSLMSIKIASNFDHLSFNKIVFAQCYLYIKPAKNRSVFFMLYMCVDQRRVRSLFKKYTGFFK